MTESQTVRQIEPLFCAAILAQLRASLTHELELSNAETLLNGLIQSDYSRDALLPLSDSRFISLHSRIDPKRLLRTLQEPVLFAILPQCKELDLKNKSVADAVKQLLARRKTGSSGEFVGGIAA